MLHSSTRRIRLIKHLRSHGLRDLEYLREDELLSVMANLKQRLPEVVKGASFHQGTSASSQPSSHTLVGNLSIPKAKPGPATSTLPESDCDDPHALPRFREPKIRLPEGQRSFLRLIPVCGESIFVTWDLNADDRTRANANVPKLRLRYLDESECDQSFDVNLDVHGWYVAAARDATRVQCEILVDDEVLLKSNVAVVPSSRPAPIGPVIYASLSPTRSRTDLALEGLLDAVSNAVEGVTVEVTAENALIPDFHDALQSVGMTSFGEDGDSPSSGELHYSRTSPLPFSSLSSPSTER